MPTMYARLFPWNPRQGYMVRGYNYREINFKGGERPNWYEISEELARELGAFKQIETDPRSLPLFQICTEEQKATLEQAEQGRYLAQLGIAAQTVSLPKDFQPPQTVRLVAAEAPPPLTASTAPVAADARSAAIPAPRAAGRRTARAVQPESESGAVTTADVPNSAKSDEGTPASE